MKIKLGFVGYGKSTHRYHMPFINQEKYDIMGYYTRGTRVFEMEYPQRPTELIRFESIDDLLKSEVELIVITTPAQLHYEYAKKALLAKKHVLVEKPLCYHLEELQELYALAKNQGVTFLPYQNRRYDSDFLTLKHVLNNYDLGTVFEIESNHTQYRLDNIEQEASIYEGSIYGHAVHFVDQIVSHFGAPDKILYDICNQKHYALAGTSEISPEDYYDIRLIYNFLRIRVRFSQLIIHEDPRWIVHGSKASFKKYMIDQQERDLKKGIFPYDKDFGKDTEYGIGTLYHLNRDSKKIATVYGGYQMFYDQIFECIVNKQDPPVRYEEAHTVLKILETIALKKEWHK